MLTCDVRQLLNFLSSIEQIKKEMRHSWLSDGRQESTAEHCWRLALMVMLVAPYLQQAFDVDRAIKMALLHDIVEAEVGDILAVDLLEVELHDYGWQAIVGGFGFLTDRFPNPKLNIHKIDIVNKTTMFNDKIKIPLKPFPGIMGVAPDTEEMLSTIPPRANGGNMDDPSLVEGTTVYFPVFVKGALFSIGDGHAVQGYGEVCGSAIEAPMTFTYRVRVIKDRPAIKEPQYETDEYYAVTGFGETIDIATKKAVNYMVDHLSTNYNVSEEDAYMLCSLAGDLKIAEVVDVPNMLVTMHFPKTIINQF